MSTISNINLSPEWPDMVSDKVATGLYSLAPSCANALHSIEEKERFSKLKLDQLRTDIWGGIASSDAGTLDVEEIKRRAPRV